MSGRKPFVDQYNHHLLRETATPEDQNTEHNQRPSEVARKKRLPQSSPGGIQSVPKHCPNEDGRSVSSDMRALSLQQRVSTLSNKRPAAELAPDPSYGESGRPSKLRTGDSLGRGPSLHSPAPSHESSPADHLGSKLTPRDRLSLTFQPVLDKNNPPLAHPQLKDFASTSPPSSPAFDTGDENILLLQPETQPITQEQLVNEVKGIYAGLVMVEKKCVQVDQEQSATTNKLSNEQWQALIALHRTLLHEHHDFFLASQHPSASATLRHLATKYAMPARMWRHGIHSFLEVLRHRLPDSLDHMLAFVYLAYSMMGLLMESVPSFEHTWIECLGDLARYRMAIEEVDLRDREVWSGVGRMWYNKAAGKSPNIGRIQHHLAVLARPNIVQQLFYYSKALVSVVPFQNTRESIMLLFNPFLEENEIASQRYPSVESAFVKAHGILFMHGTPPADTESVTYSEFTISDYKSHMDQFCSILNGHIGRVTAKFRVQGPEIASSLCAATFDFGHEKAFLSSAFRIQSDQRKEYIEAYQSSHGQEEPPPEDPKDKYASMKAYWASIDDSIVPTRVYSHTLRDSTSLDTQFSASDCVADYACHYLGETTTVIAQRIGDKNVLPYMHVVLAYLFGLSFVPDALLYVEGCVPWDNITTFLNTLGRSGVVRASFEGTDFPKHLSGTGLQLPEDFVMRGLNWAQHYFPAEFFSEQIVDEDERDLGLPSHGAPRAERCLWLGVQLASLNRWMHYDSQNQMFSTTEFVRSLESMRTHELESRSRTMSIERDQDVD